MDPTDQILAIIKEGRPDTLSRIAEIVCANTSELPMTNERVVLMADAWWKAEVQKRSAEIARLTKELQKANDQAQHFERLWYLTPRTYREPFIPAHRTDCCDPGRMWCVVVRPI